MNSKNSIYFDKFSRQNVAIIGDLMLDKYIFGSVDRISPEAPIPIVRIIEERFYPGGASNVATNISTLRANPYLFGLVGDDDIQDHFIQVIREFQINTDGVLADPNRSTIQKIRVIGQNQQLLRIDYEDQIINENSYVDKMLDQIKSIPKLSVIIVSDYAKGTITSDLMSKLKEFSLDSGIKIIADPKPINKELYKGVYLLTPNKKEAEELSGTKINDLHDVERVGKQLQKELNSNIIITLGDRGMAVFEHNKEYSLIPTVAKEVYDVSGAGDTVVASISLALSSGATLKEAANISNFAAGIKVGKMGTAPVFLEELRNIED